MRKSRAIKSIVSYLVYYIVVTLLGFYSKKVILYYVGSELLGLNELLASIISMLSLVELGFGSAICYSLYKPLAENNEYEICAIMYLYKRVYQIIGGVILIIGILLLPFLKLFVNTHISDALIYEIYLILLIDTVLSYYLAYRRSIISADQKEYIAILADTITYIITLILQIIVLILYKNFIAFLGIKIIFTLARNIYIYCKAGKMYPYIQKHGKYILPQETKEELINNVKAIFLGNIGCYMISGTDNMFLSLFVDLSAVYIYSNYKMIITIVNSVFNQIFAYARATIGNYIVTNERDKTYSLFKKMFFMNYIVTSYTSITMYVAINPFINIWLGQEFCWPMLAVFLLLIKNYASMMNQVLEAFRAAAGLFAPKKIFRYVAIIEGIANIIISVFLAKYLHMGIFGIFGGTVISNLISVFTVPHIVYKYLFKISIIQYLKKYISYFMNTLIVCIFDIKILDILNINNGIFAVIAGILSSTLVMFIYNYILYARTEEFAYMKNSFIEIVAMIKSKSVQK